MIGGCLAPWIGWWAAWRRRRGLYDRFTLRLRWCAWRLHPGPMELLNLLSLRRDLGQPLPGRWRRQLERWLPGLRGRAHQRGQDLLNADQGPLALAMQAERARFARWLVGKQEAARASGVNKPEWCVVGNSAALLQSGLGGHIDAHVGVVRFNQWRGLDTLSADTGVALDVWVVSPGFQPTLLEPVPWVVVSGPDPQAVMQRWRVVKDLRAAGATVLTVPLPIWRELVTQLQAPPSAGLLMLAWWRAMQGGWAGVNIAGIGAETSSVGVHHLLGPGHRVGSRHRWVRERALVRSWQAQGLLCLGSVAVGARRQPG
jgi:hypothetical protein